MSAARTIGDHIGRKLGLIPQDRWVGALERAEPDLIRRGGRSLDELARVIENEPETCLELAGILSVGETYFLRHGAHFDVVVAHVERRLAELPRGEQVQIWSAGCSSGEEPYSIAIAIHARLGADALERVRIVGTDVDARAIAKAKGGRFTAWSFRGAPPWLQPTYFSGIERSGATLEHPAVKRAVRFETMPLATRAPTFAPGSLDVVLFRNVAIYLLDDARIALQEDMRRALRDGGLLVQGPSDPPPPTHAFGLLPNDSTYCCYEAGRVTASGSTLRARLEEKNANRAHPLRATNRPSALRARKLPVKPSVRDSERPLPVFVPGAARVPSVAQDGAPPVEPKPTMLGTVTKLRSAEDVEQALRDAERGHVDDAMTRLGIAGDSHDALARLLRGKVFVAARKMPEAIEELRAAVFLEPGAILTRYWYATALHAARREKLAVAQLRELERRLEAVTATSTVDDGETLAMELLSAVRLLLEGYR